MNDAVQPARALGGQELSNALRTGIHRLIAREEVINKINVFPVPDGDTGTNLALTLQAVLAALRATPESHAGALLTRVADAALDGARGNSGAILAQFLLGVGDRIAPLSTLTTPEFAEALAAGAAYARESLAEPREGTILTVIGDFAEAARAATARGVDDFRPLFREALAAARVSLEATPSLLEMLRRANVVDAGALGFVELVSGMTDYFETGIAPADDASIQLLSDDETTAGSQVNLEHRYCTECTITGSAIDRRRLREEATSLGSSLVVAGTQSKVRLHLHTNEPQQLFALAARYGAVGGEKADDMQRQQEMAHHASRRRVAVVIDSAADLPESVLEALDIHVVPVRVHFGTQSFLDKVGLSSEEFFRMLASSPVQPKTSQPPPGDFRRAFEFLGSHYQAVVYVGLMSKVSGTFQSAETAISRVRTRAKILAYDSGTAALGQGLIAMRAAEVAAEGGDAEAVLAAAKAAGGVTRTWGSLVTLEFAVRGGRVPAWIKPVANALRLVPVLMVRSNGSLGIGGVLFGRNNLYRRFGKLLLRRLDPARRWRIGIAHANVPEGAAAVREQLTSGLPRAEILPVIPLGTALGVHTGPGCVVVAAQELP
ncbi:MAG TPA: DegV family protein [Steroidobacteraceae bacterium]|jgi:DegV family protein with EDD domain|nr:DegV family protein [Steroidobacteraceae bacterium]